MGQQRAFCKPKIGLTKVIKKASIEAGFLWKTLKI